MDNILDQLGFSESERKDIAKAMAIEGTDHPTYFVFGAVLERAEYLNTGGR
ncbi:hypothetical protein ACFXG4_23520 [Nocardia sp. NPDC059246]